MRGIGIVHDAQGMEHTKDAEVSDRRAHGNENTTGANGGSLH